jgi:hypothetical protein
VSREKKMKEPLLIRLKDRIGEMEGLGKTSTASPVFMAWRRETEGVLKELFGDESAEAQEFNAIYYTPVFLTCRMDDGAFEEAFHNGLMEAEILLQSLLTKIRQKSADSNCF